MSIRSLLAAWLVAPAAAAADPGVVINEIFYNAPGGMEDLQWVEIHNPAGDPVDLGGWEITKGIRYRFPPASRIEANGYRVICRNPERFRESYGFAADGVFERSLARGGERVELVDARGKVADSVEYSDGTPWPAAPDGRSASLERISPFAASDLPENWAGSPLPADSSRPAGSPGKQNASHSANLPPVVSGVDFTPARPAPEEAVTVEASIADKDGVDEASLRYRVAGPGSESEESAVAMARIAGDRFRASIPGQKAGAIIRFRIRAADVKGAERFHPAAGEPRPAFSVLVAAAYGPGKIPLGLIINPDRSEHAAAGRRDRPGPGGFPGFRFGPRPAAAPPPARGRSAFILVDPETRKPELYDFVRISERSGGYKVRFNEDQTLNGMTVINLIHEHNERFVLAEPLAYELYRRAGNAAELTDFVRLSIDGTLLGYHLLVEQPNRAFLRRNKLDDSGNLYKILWYEQGAVGQHEKKTNLHTGHDDLLEVLDLLERTEGEEEWAVIEKHFNVPQVINYFAVNTCLSHWDGFFNNYFAYHDTGTSGKWEMFPWDQDKTWGYHDGIREEEVFFDMPLTFGMAGDAPPGAAGAGPGRRGFGGFGFGGGGRAWWRPGGWFSSPLLANPEFRRRYLARTREILETVYTERTFFPLIDAMGERLEEEVRIRASATREDPDRASERLRRNLRSLKDNLVKRREFLLAQPELKE